MFVKDVERRDKELVSVVLLISGQVVRMRPHQVEHSMRDVGDDVATVEFLKHTSMRHPGKHALLCARPTLTWKICANSHMRHLLGSSDVS